MTLVKSPYNFVPAPDKHQVFEPKWAKDVSHDIPFEDGESGEIEIEITAETPIFIRNGYKKPIEDEKPTEEFSHFLDKNGQKQYFIPATSLKGMARNVMEIISFSRLNKELVHNSRFSQRDISTADTQYMKKYQKDKIKAGWLSQDEDGNWTIEECESFSFIDHRELKEKLKIPFRDFFLVTKRFDKPRKILKSAKEKYEELKKLSIGLEHSFSIGEKKLFGNVVLSIATIGGSRNGTLVLTGQPAKRIEEEGKKASGKVREFVFFNSDDPKKFDIHQDLKEDIKFIYNDHDKHNISPDWGYFRDNFLIKGKKVPVFFSANDKEVKHFGLAYMYKLPYDNKIHDLYPFKGYEHSKDFVQVLFGYTSKKEALKGRLFFGHALAESETVKVLPKVEAVLGGPKASYFPFYLKQFKDKGGYFTYDDPNATLRGFKRYPVRSKEVKTSAGDNTKVVSHFKPLDKNVKFKGKLRFHNLKSVEIGAIFSALTFHGYSDTFYHSLGAAKPFGYGKVKVTINGSKYLKRSPKEYMLDFENLMEKNYPNWLSSSQIKELFAMAKGEVNEEYLSYPVIKDFITIKQENEGLDPFTEFFENVDPSKIIKPFAVRLKPQNQLQLEGFDNYQDLSKFLNEEISIFGEFMDKNKDLVFNKIVQIIEAKHKDSVKKLRKESHWDGNITNWLGEEMKNKLQEKLKELL